MITISEMVALLERSSIIARNEIDVPTEALMRLVEIQAKEALGTYRFGWKVLAQSTQDDRARHGYMPDEPLLRTGHMHDSIESDAQLTSYGAEGVVGSGDRIAVYQELGTATIPARSFLGGAMFRCEEAATPIFGAFAVKLLTFG